MDMQTDTAQTAPHPAIVLRNVRFSYPGTPAPKEDAARAGSCAEALAGVTAVTEGNIVYMPADTYTNEGIQTYTEFFGTFADALEKKA